MNSGSCEEWTLVDSNRIKFCNLYSNPMGNFYPYVVWINQRTKSKKAAHCQ